MPTMTFVLSRAPFDSAILTFLAMSVLVITHWSENYGDANAPVSQSFLSAWRSIKSGSLSLLVEFSSRKKKEFFSRSENFTSGNCSSLVRSLDVRLHSGMDARLDRSLEFKQTR